MFVGLCICILVRMCSGNQERTLVGCIVQAGTAECVWHVHRHVRRDAKGARRHDIEMLRRRRSTAWCLFRMILSRWSRGPIVMHAQTHARMNARALARSNARTHRYSRRQCVKKLGVETPAIGSVVRHKTRGSGTVNVFECL